MFNLDDLLAEPNEFRVCDKCKATNLTTLLPRLKEIDPKAKIYQGCQSYCGPGRDRSFVFINNKPILAENEDEVSLKKTKKSILMIFLSFLFVFHKSSKR